MRQLVAVTASSSLLNCFIQRNVVCLMITSSLNLKETDVRATCIPLLLISMTLPNIETIN